MTTAPQTITTYKSLFESPHVSQNAKHSIINYVIRCDLPDDVTREDLLAMIRWLIRQQR